MRLLALRAETMQAMRRLKLPCDDITPIGLWGSDMYLIGVNNEQFEVLRLWNVQTEDITPATLRDFHTESPAVPTTPSAGNAASDARFTATEASSATPPLSASKAAPTAPRAAPAARLVETSESAPAPLRGAQTQAKSYSPPPAPQAAPSAPSPALDIVPPIAAVAQAPVAQAQAPEAPTIVRSEPGPELGVGNGPAGMPSSSDRGAPALTLESNIGSASRGSRSDEPKASKGSRGGGAAAASAPNGGDTEVKHAPPKEKQESSAGKLRMTVDGEHLYAEIKGGKIVLKDRTYDSLAHARDSIRRERNKVAVWEYFDEGVKAWRVLNRD
jgi:hypothetical protein